MTDSPWRGPPELDPARPKPRIGEDRSQRIIRLAGDLLEFTVTAMGAGNPEDKISVVGSLYAGMLGNALAHGLLTQRDVMELLTGLQRQANEVSLTVQVKK